jgi:AMP deaminase
MAEYRISIYGRKQEEWDQLARWIVENELYSENVTWLIQVRFGVLSEIKLVLCITQSFETVLENVFAPLFEVTVDPSSHPKLHVLLSMVSRIPKL